jgi:hypothetical protein
MSQFWSPLVHSLTPYVPGEQPKLANLIKLNTNENPYPPSPHAVAAMQAEMGADGDTLRLYPDPNADRLKEAVARHFADFGIGTRNIFVGNGSDEVLAHAFMALLKHDKPLLLPDITYSFYPVYCELYGIDSIAIPLGEQFEIRVDDYARDNGGIILANPNAPTGQLLSLAEIERLVAAHPQSVVVIDEAYIDFGGETAIALVTRYPNLLVIRTLSKSHSLAGATRRLRRRPHRPDRSARSRQEQLQLVPARPPGDRRCGGGNRRQGTPGENAAGRHGEPRDAGRRLGATRLRRPALGGELHLRAPPATRCGQARRPAT